MKLEFGLNRYPKSDGEPVPDDAVAAWGARAILDRYGIHIPWDRQGRTGEKADLKVLCAWLDQHGLPWLEKECKERYITGDSNVLLECHADGYHLLASPLGSHGYLYISAWMEAE